MDQKDLCLIKSNSSKDSKMLLATLERFMKKQNWKIMKCNSCTYDIQEKYGCELIFSSPFFTESAL